MLIYEINDHTLIVHEVLNHSLLFFNERNKFQTRRRRCFLHTQYVFDQQDVEREVNVQWHVLHRFVRQYLLKINIECIPEEISLKHHDQVDCEHE